MKISSLICCYAVPVLALSACTGSTVKDTLGLSRSTPDEFRVVSRPPLSVPPDFSLRPPSDTVSLSGSDTPASKQAEALILSRKDSGGSAAAASGSDARFLQKAGTGQADSGIRERLRAETGEAADPEEKSMLQKLREPSRNEPLVDAVREKERLNANKSSGKPVTDGDTPTVKARDRGILGKIF